MIASFGDGLSEILQRNLYSMNLFFLFRQRMAEHEKFFFQYSGDDMNTVTTPFSQLGQRPRILVTHDESCFSSHDGKPTIWMDNNDRPLRPKGQGRSIMMSKLVCEIS